MSKKNKATKNLKSGHDNRRRHDKLGKLRIQRKLGLRR